MSTYFAEIETAPCKKDQIDWKGNSDGKALIFKPSEESERDALRFYDKLQCLSQDLAIAGDFNSASGMSLVLTFSMCRGKPTCKPEHEINEWMKRKFLLVMENTVTFDRQIVENSGLKKNHDSCGM